MHNINNTNNAQFDDKNPPASPKVFAFVFFAENRYICTVMQGDTAAAQANGQAGARPCKMTVGDAGTEAEKPSQFVDIHRAYIRAEAPLSRTFQSPFGDFFCERICAKKENFNLYINTLQSNLRSSSGAKLFR